VFVLEDAVEFGWRRGWTSAGSIEGRRGSVGEVGIVVGAEVAGLLTRVGGWWEWLLRVWG
jgi:hypothetical protein